MNLVVFPSQKKVSVISDQISQMCKLSKFTWSDFRSFCSHRWIENCAHSRQVIRSIWNFFFVMELSWSWWDSNRFSIGSLRIEISRETCSSMSIADFRFLSIDLRLKTRFYHEAFWSPLGVPNSVLGLYLIIFDPIWCPDEPESAGMMPFTAIRTRPLNTLIVK